VLLCHGAKRDYITADELAAAVFLKVQAAS
jgi:hypothetical protein